MSDNSKYELIASDERPLGPDREFYRLKAKRDIGKDVKTGDLGGLVGGPHNLAEEGDCWIYPNALVCDGATIRDNAKVRGTTRLMGRVSMRDNSEVTYEVQLLGDILLKGDDKLEDRIQVVYLDVLRTGQYRGIHGDMFAFVCRLSAREVHFAIRMADCYPAIATELATLTPNSRLCFISKMGIPFPLQASGTYEEVRLQDIEKALNNRTHVISSKVLDLLHVTRIG